MQAVCIIRRPVYVLPIFWVFFFLLITRHSVTSYTLWIFVGLELFNVFPGFYKVEKIWPIVFFWSHNHFFILANIPFFNNFWPSIILDLISAILALLASFCLFLKFAITSAVSSSSTRSNPVRRFFQYFIFFLFIFSFSRRAWTRSLPFHLKKCLFVFKKCQFRY